MLCQPVLSLFFYYATILVLNVIIYYADGIIYYADGISTKKVFLQPVPYVACTRKHWNGHDTLTRDKFFKIHTIRVSDTRVGHVSDTTRLHDTSVRAT